MHPDIPTETEPLTHSRCVEIAAKWAAGRCGVVLPEFVTINNREIPDVIAFKPQCSYMIEVKVSRSDFLRDKNKVFRNNEAQGMGNYRYYACPRQLIGPLEVPDGWGLIYIYPNGKAREMMAPDRKPANLEAERTLLYSYARRAVYKGVHAEILKPIPKRDSTI